MMHPKRPVRYYRFHGIASRMVPIVLIGAMCAAIFLTAPVNAGMLWTKDGVAVSASEPIDQVCSAPDGAGGAFIAWRDDRNEVTTGYDVYANRVTSAGTKAWASDLVVANDAADERYPQIASDGAGGAFIAWQYTNVDLVRMQRVSAAGAKLWGSDTIVTDVSTTGYGQMDMVADGFGGAIIAWEEYRNPQYDIYASRIDSNGTLHPGWTTDGNQVTDSPFSSSRNPVIDSDRTGGAVIAWDNYDDLGNINAQRLDGDGAEVWAHGGVSVCTEAHNQSDQQIVWSTGGSSPGPVITWEDDRVAYSPSDVYALKLNAADGSTAAGGAWIVNGVCVCPDPGPILTEQRLPMITGDGAGGAIIAWEDDNGTASTGYDIYAQHMDQSGNRLWAGDLGIPVSNAARNQATVSIATDGANGAYFAWQDWTANGDICAQRLDASGEPELVPNGARVCGNEKGQDDPIVTFDGTHPPVIVWSERREYLDWTLYAQSFNNTAPTVTSITPSEGENDQTVSVTDLAGTNFDRNGVTVKLKKAGHADVTATDVVVESLTKATCKLPLAGVAPGVWDLYVQNSSDASSATKAGAFTVTEATSPEPPEPPGPPGPTPTSSPTWYLPEGSTAWGYQCYITIVNPNEEDVTADITYMTPAGEVPGPTVGLKKKSQATVNPADTLGAQDFSTRVVCGEGGSIAVDRTMVWLGEGALSTEAHSSVGVTAPAKVWYLPEGSSNWGFECWLLVQNPNAAEANCTITYMTQDRGPVPVQHTVPANGRASFNMQNDIGAADASIKVDSDMDVIPERAMYRNARREGHDSIGTTTAARDYYLAEGCTQGGFTTFVLVQNPNDTATDVVLTFMTPGGSSSLSPFTMNPNSRTTVKLNDVAPGVDVSTRVTGSQPVIAERAMYWDAGTGEACHDSIGMECAHKSFCMPDGQTSDGRETFTLVQNPNTADVTVRITYLSPEGSANVVFEDTIPASSRRTYNMRDKGIDGRAGVLVESLDAVKKIMCERAMYWNSRGAGTDTIGGFSD